MTDFVHGLTRCRFLSLALAVALMTLAPTASSVSATAPAAVPAGGTAQLYDRLFIDMMAPHHEGAVAMARIALVRARHRQIRTLAQQIITAQENEIATMRNWRVGWFGSAATPDMAHMPPLPGLTMQMDMMGGITYLKSETAVPFDKAFINEMIPHHQMAIAAAKLELTYGRQPQLQAMALSIIESQAREVGLMQAYRELWYGVPAGATHSSAMLLGADHW